MESFLRYLVLFTSVCVCSAQYKCTTLPTDLATCSTNHLSKMPEIAEMLRGNTDFIATAVVLPYWKTMCQYSMDVKKFFTCSFTAMNNCIEAEYNGIYPDASRFNQGFDYACNKINDLDEGCYQVSRAAIHSCATSAAGSSPSGTDAQAVIRYNCRIFAEEVKCSNKKLNSCLDTKDIVEMYHSFLSRPVCSAISFRASTAFSIVMLLVSYFVKL